MKPRGPGMDIDAMIAGRQAQVRELAEFHQAQANGGTYPYPAPTHLQAALGLRANEQAVDAKVRPAAGTEETDDRY